MNNQEAAANEELSQVLRDYIEVAERFQSTHRALEREVGRRRGELKPHDLEPGKPRRRPAFCVRAARVRVQEGLGAT